MNAVEVHIVIGWFGSEEWIESVWAVQSEAEAECGRLWEKRRSDELHADDYRQGVCKFQVVTEPLRRSS